MLEKENEGERDTVKLGTAVVRMEGDAEFVDVTESEGEGCTDGESSGDGDKKLVVVCDGVTVGVKRLVKVGDDDAHKVPY